MTRQEEQTDICPNPILGEEQPVDQQAFSQLPTKRVIFHNGAASFAENRMMWPLILDYAPQPVGSQSEKVLLLRL